MAAANRGCVIPLFIWSPDEEGGWPPGSATRWWLHQSLKSLDANLQKTGSRLVIRRGPALEAIRSLAKEYGVDAIFWNRRYEPAIIARDANIQEVLRGDGLQVKSFNAALLHEPWTIRNKKEKPFQVFTPFWKHCLNERDPAEPLPAPKPVRPPACWPKSLTLAALELEPKINWTGGMREVWQAGEAGANENLSRFLKNGFSDYSENRNRPDLAGTSRLSPHLHFGEISPRQIWHNVKDWAAKQGLSKLKWRESRFLTELGWREFAHHLLFHFPQTPDKPLRHEFEKFPWRKNEKQLRAWQQGKTGFPIVDAGLRELWKTGWMHNRVRMIVASFLVKDLLMDWREGTRWFWDTLVDADLANNTLGWQWTAGCGADAAPYFRVFNPVIQGEKFDPNGRYIRKWCPELAKLAAPWIHQPHQAPPDLCRAAGVRLGENYPRPMVDHAVMREKALEVFAGLKRG